MRKSNRYHFVGNLIIFILCSILMNVSPGVSQSGSGLIVSVDSIIAQPGEQNVEFTINLANYSDTLAYFEIWLYLNRPDICEFTTDFDTAGTLLSGWEKIHIMTDGSGNHDLLIYAGADTLVGGTTPPLAPQGELAPLIKLYTNVYEIPEEWTDRSAEIIIGGNFYGPNGEAVPSGMLVTDTLIVSYCYTCDYWIDPESTECWEYTSVPCDTEGVPIDSIWCCDTAYTGHIDTTVFQLINGEISVSLYICGDLNYDYEVNIFDIVTLIRFIYEGYQDEYGYPFSYWDLNDDNNIDIFDVVYLISFLYLSGPAPICD
jgi:hypothetical protein